MRKLFYALICIFICACTPVIEESDFVENQESEMRILTRSSVEINYPMVLYAFDITTGNMAAYTTVSSDTDDAILYLPKGNYQIVALTGLPVIDKKPALNDVITLSSYMDAPIQMGSAAVYATQNSTVSIMLYNQVSAVDIMLSGIPTDATACIAAFATTNALGLASPTSSAAQITTLRAMNIGSSPASNILAK